MACFLSAVPSGVDCLLFPGTVAKEKRKEKKRKEKAVQQLSQASQPHFRRVVALIW